MPVQLVEIYSQWNSTVRCAIPTWGEISPLENLDFHIEKSEKSRLHYDILEAFRVKKWFEILKKYK